MKGNNRELLQRPNVNALLRNGAFIASSATFPPSQPSEAKPAEFRTSQRPTTTREEVANLLHRVCDSFRFRLPVYFHRMSKNDPPKRPLSRREFIIYLFFSPERKLGPVVFGNWGVVRLFIGVVNLWRSANGRSYLDIRKQLGCKIGCGNFLPFVCVSISNDDIAFWVMYSCPWIIYGSVLHHK